MSVNHDYQRKSRTGIPESVLAEPKSKEDLVKAIEAGMQKNRTLLVTRILDTQLETIQNLISDKHWHFQFDDFNRTLILSVDIFEEPKEIAGAIFAAGTSDRYIVEEIKICLRFFGWNSLDFLDVGVAGLHRFKEALEQIQGNSNVQCLIIVAGQDGALFPVVAGQTKLPIIAVPSPVGYGYGGSGKASLMSALQACAPGIAVVNIENGFGAAAFAAKILNRIKERD